LVKEVILDQRSRKACGFFVDKPLVPLITPLEQMFEKENMVDIQEEGFKRGSLNIELIYNENHSK
jgi:hypothetical protein